MKLALFGGTGETGQAIRQLAKKFGCELSLHSRHPGLAGAVVGDINVVANEVVHGCDAVVIALGARSPNQDVFLAESTQAIVQACHANNVHRIICVTGALVGDYPNNQGSLFKWLANKFGQKSAASMADKAKQEEIIKASGLNWTIVKPPRLTSQQKEQHYIAGSSIHCGLFSKISRQTLAYDIGKCLTNEASFGMVRFIKAIKD